uniref:Uncharacterized protein n=1 Tax=Arundo donax TaxID=35708 RepID=A0A0A8ZIG0_ARUDO
MMDHLCSARKIYWTAGDPRPVKDMAMKQCKRCCSAVET